MSDETVVIACKVENNQLHLCAGHEDDWQATIQAWGDGIARAERRRSWNAWQHGKTEAATIHGGLLRYSAETTLPVATIENTSHRETRLLLAVIVLAVAAFAAGIGSLAQQGTCT